MQAVADRVLGGLSERDRQAFAKLAQL